MIQHYILVEGINIYANVLDTNQLSVIRGSSFLLKHAIDHISESFKEQLTPLSTGASSGLFLLNDGFKGQDLSSTITDELNKPDKGFNLLSFVVEHCVADNLLQAKEQLIAQLRMTQMQALTLVPDVNNQAVEMLNQPDELEGRRVATAHREVIIQKKPRQLSHSVLTRWDYGKDLKHNYYFQEKKLKQPEKLEQLKAYGFSAHFEDLAENEAYSKLNGKIAVIYMDGNSFSKKQKKIIEQAQEKQQDLFKKQQEIDETIQSNRAEFLMTLLLAMIDKQPDSAFSQALLKKGDQQIIRFETLLWGGDEMLFVLPAWLGFEFIHYFFEQTKDWKMGEPLTHAAGLVFCSAKTPISRIQSLSTSIADTLKEVNSTESPNDKSGRDQNGWNYIILESIDYPTNNSIDDFNNKHYGELASSKPKFIPALKHWNSYKPKLKKLIHGRLIPRRQLYRLVQATTSAQAQDKTATLSWQNIKSIPEIENPSPQEKQELRLLEVSEYKAELIEILPQIAEQVFSLNIEQPQDRIWLWIYLYELWDYICPQTDTPADAGERQ